MELHGTSLVTVIIKYLFVFCQDRGPKVTTVSSGHHSESPKKDFTNIMPFE